MSYPLPRCMVLRPLVHSVTAFFVLVPNIAKPGIAKQGFAKPGFAKPGIAKPGFASPTMNPQRADQEQIHP